MLRAVHNAVMRQMRSTLTSDARPQTRFWSSLSAPTSTIFALSTPPGRGAVAVVRISGPRTRAVLEAMVEGGVPPARMASLRRLVRPGSRDIDVLDRGIVLFFPSPRSATGEDVAELHLHASPAVLRAVLAALPDASSDVREAAPGEFARRGYMNGVLDTSQLEAMALLLRAETEHQRRLAMRHLAQGSSTGGTDGAGLRPRMDAWKSVLLGCLSRAEAALDFSDEGVDADASQVACELRVLHDEMSRSLERSERASGLAMDGTRVALIGRPNAGKSSLMNYLSMRDVAITSPEPGTTRDVLEVACAIGGLEHKILVTDTAGVRGSGVGTTQDDAGCDDGSTEGDRCNQGAEQEQIGAIEREGMKRALYAATTTDIAVLVVDVAAAIQERMRRVDIEDVEERTRLLSWLRQMIVCEWWLPFNASTIHNGGDGTALRLLVMNKIDQVDARVVELLQRDLGRVTAGTGGGSGGNDRTSTCSRDDSLHSVSFVSCVTGEGMDAFVASLADAVSSLTSSSSSSTSPDEIQTGTESSGLGLMLMTQRQQQLVRTATSYVQDAIDLCDEGKLEIAAACLRSAAFDIGKVAGFVETEDVLQEIFSQFCIGK